MATAVDPRVPAVLNRLDWALGEAGRRQHRFGWLLDAMGQWVALAAYYPSSRVVVIAEADPDTEARCRFEVPAHGLYLIVLDPGELTLDPAALARDLRLRLIDQGWQPAGAGRPPAEALPAVVPPQVARPSATPRAAQPPVPRPRLAPGPVAAPRPTVAATAEPAIDPAPTPDTELTFGPTDTLPPPAPQGPAAARTGARRTPVRHGSGDPAAGVTLVIVAALELSIGGGVIGLGAGDPILGFGFVLDACARGLGTVAASQADDTDAAWSAVLFGSPALWGLDRSPGQDVAAAAQVTAVLAALVIALGLLVAIL